MLSDYRVAAMMPSQNIERARSFYEDKLKLTPSMEMPDGSAMYECGNGTMIGVFPSTGRSDGSYTQAGFWVDDVEAEMRDLRSRGIVFEEYDMPGFKSVDGLVEIEGYRGAWFKDPDGNLLSVGEGEPR